MKALGKIIGLIVIGLLLIIVGLGFALTHLFDPNDYKDEIRQLARDKASLELNLKGDIGWSLFPWLGLELTDATLASVDTPDKPFASLRLLGLSVRVLPLLRKELQMSNIRVDGLTLDLQRDEKGHSNWEGVGQPATRKTVVPAAAKAANEKQSDTQTTSVTETDSALKLDIDSLIVNGGRINYSDLQKGQQFSAESIQLTTGAISEGASVPIKLSAFFGVNQPLIRARSELQGNLRFDRALKRYQLEDSKLSGEISGEPFNGQTLTYSAQGQLLLDQSANIAEWNGLKLSANQLRALGELKVHGLNNNPKISGGLSIAPLNLREFLTTIGQTLPAMDDAQALSQFELVTRLSGTPNSASLDDLKITLDDSHFNGQVALTDLAKQALRVQLKGDQLNLDRYLSSAEKATDSQTAARASEVKESLKKAGEDGTTALPNAPTQQAWSSSEVLPLQRLRKLNMQLELGLDQLTLKQQKFSDIGLKAQAKSGLLSLQQANGKLASGSFTATGSIDARPEVAQLSLNSSVKQLPVELFLEKPEQPTPVKGQLDLTAALKTSGNSQRAWVDGLNGNIKFKLNNGVLVGANLEQQLCRGIAILNRKILSNQPRGKDTPFDTLQGSLQINHGVASNPDLNVAIPGLAMKGDGTLDLRILSLDYHLGLIIEGDTRAMPDPACQVNSRYAGIEWPIRCRGPLEMGAKACRLDEEGLGKVATKLAGKKLNEKIEEKLSEKVSPELKEALKGLFKR